MLRRFSSTLSLRQFGFIALGLLVLAVLAVWLATARAQESDPPATEQSFASIWERTDLPVRDQSVSRTWIWGPEPRSAELTEVYVDAPVGQRRVLYYDKSRMEITDPAADSSEPWFVTNGLLVVEMITGELQVGDDTFRQHDPADDPVAGDMDDTRSPTYRSMQAVLADEPRDEDEVIVERIDRNGDVRVDDSFAEHDIRADYLVPETNHRVAAPFWAFLTSEGQVWDGEELTHDALFPEPFFATGFPITEAYWTSALVGGEVRDVLLQCFERRCMTFTPGNTDGFEVEAGNVGLHYYTWRYEEIEFGMPTEYPEALDQLPVASVGEGEAALRLEVSEANRNRQCGLMHRRTMPADYGMLFVFDEDRSGGFWNCNTFVPLTLAWIAEDGTIVDLTDMQPATPGEPQDPETIRSPEPYRYVIEANQGWFDEHGVDVGDQFDLNEALDAGQTTDVPICAWLGTECGG